jgi:uncharacterized RDD family membrane protein YckC
VTQANDDAVAVGHPPAGGPVRAPVPPQAGGPPFGGPPPGPQPGIPFPPGPRPGGPPPPYGYYGPPQHYGWRVPLAPDGRPLADFGTRLLAHLIDGAILTVIAMIVFVPVILLVTVNLMPDFPEPGQAYEPGATVNFDFIGFLLPILLLELGLVVLLLAAYYVYYVEMMFRSGQTVGKRLMKIQVIPIDPRETLTRGMAAKRYAVEFIGGVIVPFFSYVDGLWQLWDKPYQQTLHDKAAKTVVVKVAP